MVDPVPRGERFMQQLADLGIAAEEPETGWIWLVGFFVCVCVWDIKKICWRLISGGDESVFRWFFG